MGDLGELLGLRIWFYKRFKTIILLIFECTVKQNLIINAF